MKLLPLFIIFILLPISNAELILASAETSDIEAEDSSIPNTRAVKKWSVFVYVDGDNNLERFAIEDVNEMESVGSTDDVNIVIQIDRVNGYNKSNGDWTDTRRYYITKDDHPVTINSVRLDTGNDSLGELNMASSTTLKNFLEWGLENYPAEHYLVVMWDHGRGIFRSSKAGGGIFRGFNEDLTSNTQEMKLWELDDLLLDIKANKNGGKNFDILGFDQCWLGNIETAYELMDSVDYLVASADEEPDKGWNYQHPLQTLVNNSDISPKEFSKIITNDYVDEYKNKTSYDYMTQATVDLIEFKNTYLPLMNNFTDELIVNFYSTQNILFDIRKELSNYYYPCPDFFYFVKLVRANTSLPDGLRSVAEQLLSNYSKFILAEGHGSAHPNGNGLAIYFPDSLKYDSYTKWQAEYDSKIDFASENWIEFLKLFYNPLRIGHTPLRDTEDTNNPYEIMVNIHGYKLDRDNVKLYYSFNGTHYSAQNMSSPDDNEIFATEIPAQSANTDVYYYIEAPDELGNNIHLPEYAPELNAGELYHFFVGKDIKPPKISHTPVVDKIYSKDDFEIIISVTDNIGVNPSKVKLFYKIDNDTDYVEKQMIVVSENSNQYRSYVPSQMIGTVISYYFEATDVVSVPNTARLPETGDYNFKILGLIMNIARDEYHTNDLEKYDDFFELLTAPGYNKTPISHQFDRYILKDINLLVITEPSKAFANSEIIAIKDFLDNGGRLFIIGGTNKAVMNGLTEFIDIKWTENNEGSGYSGTFGDVPSIFESVQELYYTSPGLKIESDSSVVELVSNDLNEAVLAVCSYMAQGKIFIITSGFFATETVGTASNTLFLNNIALWLIKHPIAVISGSQTKINGELVNNIHNGTLTITEDDYVGFDGNDSVNPDWQSSLLNFTWNFGDGNISYGSQPAHKYHKKGEYHVTLIVRTFDGISDSGELLIKVQNEIPTAYPGYSSIKDLSVYFDASASEDTPSDKPSLIYHWNFGDGTTDTGISPVHTYSSKGNYRVTLTVIDNDGAKSISILYLDLDDGDGSSLGNYAPAIVGIVLVIIVLIITMLYQRKKPAKPTSPPEERVGNNHKKTIRNRRVINKPQSRI